LSDSNLLVLFGTFLGIIGSVLLSIDALGANEFLRSIEKEKTQRFQMTYVGFLATINEIFVYLTVSLIGLIALLLITKYNLVISLLIAPIIFFVWKGIIFLSDKFVEFIRKTGPKRINPNDKISCFKMIILFFHAIIWVTPFLIISMIGIIIRFGLDLPLRFLSEHIAVPFVRRLYEYSAKLISEDQKWNLKRTVLIGTLFLLFGFIYQSIGVILMIKW
jgi:hypothetical protein